jgi:hypothetical protein
MRIHLGSRSSRVRRLGAGLPVLALVAITTDRRGRHPGKLNKAEQKLSKLESLIQTEQQKANAVKVNSTRSRLSVPARSA